MNKILLLSFFAFIFLSAKKNKKRQQIESTLKYNIEEIQTKQTVKEQELCNNYLQLYKEFQKNNLGAKGNFISGIFRWAINPAGSYTTNEKILELVINIKKSFEIKSEEEFGVNLAIFSDSVLCTSIQHLSFFIYQYLYLIEEQKEFENFMNGFLTYLNQDDYQFYILYNLELFLNITDEIKKKLIVSKTLNKDMIDLLYFIKTTMNEDVRVMKKIQNKSQFQQFIKNQSVFIFMFVLCKFRADYVQSYKMVEFFADYVGYFYGDLNMKKKLEKIGIIDTVYIKNFKMMFEEEKEVKLETKNILQVDQVIKQQNQNFCLACRINKIVTESLNEQLLKQIKVIIFQKDFHLFCHCLNVSKYSLC